MPEEPTVETPEVEETPTEEVWEEPEEPEAPTEPEEPKVEEPEEDELVDQRGVSWRNVAAEAKRKLEAAEEREKIYSQVLDKVPTYQGGETPAEETPAPPAVKFEEADRLIKDGKTAEGIAHIVSSILDSRDTQKQSVAIRTKATETKTQLLDDYPALADPASDLFTLTAAACEELKGEWAALGMKVDTKALTEKGLSVILERQGVERALSRNPHLIKGANVVATKQTPSPTGGVVPSPGGKPPVAKPTKGGKPGKGDIELTPEQKALREQYGLTTTDQTKLKKSRDRQGQYDAKD